MRTIISAVLLTVVKLFSGAFYKFNHSWVGDPLRSDQWGDVRLVIILNHTSLFEPVFSGVLPWRFLWRLAKAATFPAADITFNRPLLGKFFRFLAPSVISVSRSRDKTWSQFLQTCNAESVVMIAPEGRMKRPDGLDKHGQPMTVRGGVADIIAQMNWEGLIVFAYSGGLHHILSPGQGFPRLFQTAAIRMEAVDLQQYRRDMKFFDARVDCLAEASTDRQNEAYRNFRKRVISDLESRRDRFCPRWDD